MYVLNQNMKNKKFSLLKFTIFATYKNLLILHGRVFIMSFINLTMFCYNITVGNQNGSFQRKYAFPIPFGGRDGSFQRKLVDEDF